MASIVLVNPPATLEERYGTLSGAGSNLPSIGLLILGAVVRRSGHRVKIVEAASSSLSYEESLRRILEFQPDIIGITSVTSSIYKAAKLARMIKRKKPEIKIVVGGPHITAVPEETMSRFPEIDIAVIGEGEDTFNDLICNIENNSPLKDLPGILFRENDRLVKTDARALIKNLDDLPFPAWDLIDNFPWSYKAAAFKCKSQPATYIISSRGCPHLCIFCDTSVFSRQYRAFSAEYMIEMIKHLKTNFGIKEIIFEDDTFVIFK